MSENTIQETQPATTKKQRNLIFKNVIITSAGPVAALDRIAPVYNPFILEIEKILRVIMEGHRICEYREDGVLTPLTRENYNKGELIVSPIPDENNGCCGGSGEGGGIGAGLPDPTGKEGRFLKVLQDTEGPIISWATLKWDDILNRPEVITSEDLKKYATLEHAHELASSEKAGFMSATDKDKLDKYEESTSKIIKESIPNIVKTINESDKGENEFGADKVRFDDHYTVELLLEKLKVENESNKERTFVFVFPTGIMDGPLPVYKLVDYDCTLLNMSAVCEHNGNKDAILSLERISEQDFENNIENGWYDVTSDRLVLKPNNKVIPDTRLTVEKLNKGEVLRFNVLQNGGGVSTLTINLTVKKIINN